MRNSKSISKSVLIFVFGITIVKLLAFVKQIVVAYFYGSNLETDMFFLAYGFENTLTSILFASLQVSFVTLYLETKEHNEHSEFVSRTAEIFTIIGFFVSLISVLLAFPIAKVLAPTYDDESTIELMKMIRLFSAVTLFVPIATISTSVFNSEKSFFKSQIPNILMAVFDILCIIILSSKLGIYARNLGFILSTVLSAIVSIAFLRKYIKLKPVKLSIDDKQKKLIKLTAPMMIGIGMTSIMTLFDRMFGSMLETGSVSALNYSSSLYSLMISIVSTGFVTVLTTYFSELANGEKYQELGDLTYKSIGVGLIPIVYIAIVFVTFGDTLVRLIFGHGAFNEEAITLTSQALIGYAIASIIVVVKDIVTRVFYSLGDTLYPSLINGIGCIINIGISYVLCRFYGVMGITIGTAIAETIILIFLVVRLQFKFKNFSILRVFHNSWRIILSGVIICSIIVLTKRIELFSSSFANVLLAFIAFVLYIILLIIFRDQYIKEIFVILKKFVKRGKKE